MDTNGKVRRGTIEQLIAAWPIILALLATGIMLVRNQVTLEYVLEDVSEIKTDLGQLAIKVTTDWTGRFQDLELRVVKLEERDKR